MSWIKENYEKAALGGAAVIALGVGALIITGNAGEAKEEKNSTQVNTFEVPEKLDLVAYESALAKTGVIDVQKHLESDVNSFIAFPLYGVKGTEGLVELAPDTLLEGIPLSWWKKYELEDYRFAGGAAKDTDNDGFTHLEEFEGETIPTDAASHPDSIVKLEFVGAVPKKYRIQWSRVDADRANFTFTLRRSTFDICGVGGTFPTKGQPEEFLNRFKVKSKGNGENPTTKSVEDFYEIEDTKKAGVTYKMWRSDGPRRFLDWIATLKLNTPEGGEAFQVAEGGEFSLPYKEGGKGYKFKLDPNRDPNLGKLESVEIDRNGKVVPLGKAPIKSEENSIEL